MASFWYRLRKAFEYGVLWERLAARFRRRPNAELRPALQRILGAMERPIVFECGVCDGSDTRRICGWLKHGFSAYYAWEPDPRNIAHLRGRMPEGVELVEAAIGARDEQATFHLSALKESEEVGWATSCSSLRAPKPEFETWFPWAKFVGEVEVPVRSLDSFCAERGIERIDFLWADIQGAERDLVAGASRMLPRIRYLYLEQEGYPLYEGQWLYRDMCEALAKDFEILIEFPSNVLLQNKSMKVGAAQARDTTPCQKAPSSPPASERSSLRSKPCPFPVPNCAR